MGRHYHMPWNLPWWNGNAVASADSRVYGNPWNLPWWNGNWGLRRVVWRGKVKPWNLPWWNGNIYRPQDLHVGLWPWNLPWWNGNSKLIQFKQAGAPFLETFLGGMETLLSDYTLLQKYALKPSLVEWKHFPTPPKYNSCLHPWNLPWWNGNILLDPNKNPPPSALKPSLVEWKLLRMPSASFRRSTLKPSLVEWKRGAERRGRREPKPPWNLPWWNGNKRSRSWMVRQKAPWNLPWWNGNLKENIVKRVC